MFASQTKFFKEPRAQLRRCRAAALYADNVVYGITVGQQRLGKIYAYRVWRYYARYRARQIAELMRCTCSNRTPTSAKVRTISSAWHGTLLAAQTGAGKRSIGSRMKLLNRHGHVNAHWQAARVQAHAAAHNNGCGQCHKANQGKRSAGRGTQL